MDIGYFSLEVLISPEEISLEICTLTKSRAKVSFTMLQGNVLQIIDEIKRIFHEENI